MSPRFQGANLDANLALVESLRAIAAEIGATPAQVAIAWVAAQGNDIVPLVGARRRDRLTEALGAREVKLTPAHLAALAKAFPPGAAAGTRYRGRADGASGQREAGQRGSGGDQVRWALRSVITGLSPLSGLAGSRA